MYNTGILTDVRVTTALRITGKQSRVDHSVEVRTRNEMTRIDLLPGTVCRRSATKVRNHRNIMDRMRYG